jgi:hypothetical protein
MSSKVDKRFTFYGLLPPGSDRSHLAIVLNKKNEYVKYCYCTSVFNSTLLRYSEIDCFVIKKEDMAVYFPDNNKETYIYFSEEKVIDIALTLLVIKLENGEYEERPSLNESIFLDLIEAIKISENLPERFKNNLIEFLE